MITWERSKRDKAPPYTLDGTINGVLLYEIRPSDIGSAYGNKDFDLFMHHIAGQTAALGATLTPALLFDVDDWDAGKDLAEEHFRVVTALLGLSAANQPAPGGVLAAVGVLRDYLHYHDQIFRGTEYSDTFAEYIKGGLRKELKVEHLRAVVEYYDTHCSVTGEPLEHPAHQEAADAADYEQSMVEAYEESMAEIRAENTIPESPLGAWEGKDY